MYTIIMLFTEGIRNRDDYCGKSGLVDQNLRSKYYFNIKYLILCSVLM